MERPFEQLHRAACGAELAGAPPIAASRPMPEKPRRRIYGSKDRIFRRGRTGNTGAVFNLALQRCSPGDIRKIVLASTTGETAKRAMDFLERIILNWS